MLRYFYRIFALTIAVLPCCKRKKIKSFWGLCLLTQIGGLTTLPRRPVAILRAFGTSVFCFAKIRCAHIFSVLSPDINRSVDIITKTEQNRKRTSAIQDKNRQWSKNYIGEKTFEGLKIVKLKINMQSNLLFNIFLHTVNYICFQGFSYFWKYKSISKLKFWYKNPLLDVLVFRFNQLNLWRVDKTEK